MLNEKFENLKEKSIKLYDGMIVVHPLMSEEASMKLDWAPKFNGCYAANNSTVAFVADNQVYAHPYTREMISTLVCAGFLYQDFYVAFSNGDYPKFEKSKWFMLREEARQSYKDDFVADCEKYCDERHIGSISEESLKRCFVMPEEGVHVKHLYYETDYYPVMNQICLDCRCDNLGHYCRNNGRVVFVYRDGHTYVTKGYKIISELAAAGYTESSLYVPFSNGEEITNPVLKAQWDAIIK